jgi:2-amino-4-hydroxy-6-hydroxymethyldihydropteridine diphosphokinase
MILPVGIALGSNLGDREAELRGGMDFLRSLAFEGLLLESTPIETEPVDCPPGSSPFLNAVAEIELDSHRFPPLLLLDRLQAFERSRGRPERREVNAPRPLDLDILYYGDLMLHDPRLVIPHPRAIQRRFVLQPLAEIRPDLILPGQAHTVRKLFQELS